MNSYTRATIKISALFSMSLFIGVDAKADKPIYKYQSKSGVLSFSDIQPQKVDYTLLKVDCVRFDHLTEDDRLKKNIRAYKKVLYQRKSAFMDKEFWKDLERKWDRSSNGAEKISGKKIFKTYLQNS